MVKVQLVIGKSKCPTLLVQLNTLGTLLLYAAEAIERGFIQMTSRA